LKQDIHRQKFAEKIKTTLLCFITLFRKSCL